MDPTLDYSKIPSAPPPPGVTPNFVDPVTNSLVTTVVISILLPLMLAFVALRIYASLWISKRFAKSDYACILAMAASISYISILYLTISQRTLGRHIWDVPVSMNTNSVVQNFTILVILYGPAIFFAKLSVLLLYLELFAINKQTRIMVAIGITIITSQCIATITGQAVLCVPRPGVSWDIGDATHNCMVVADLYGIFMAAISLFSDLFVIYIPMPVVWRLQLPLRKKVGISVVFFTGVFACLASILALVYRIRQYQTRDNTWESALTLMLVAVEINVSIICSCMPSGASCLRHHRPSLRSVSSNLRSWYLKNGSLRKQSGSMKLDEFERANSNPDDQMRLTLGSAVKEGKFMRQPNVWPLSSIEESGKETHREFWEESTQRSVL